MVVVSEARQEKRMTTCLFTNDPTGPTTREEHTISRALGGRFYSRTCSSDDFNNKSSQPFDAEFALAYSTVLNVLAPLLSAQHQPGSLPVTEPTNERRLLLEPGAVPSFRGIHVDARDPRTNRPVAIIGADEAQLRQRARKLGWPDDQLRITTVPSTTEEVLFRKVPTISPAMEVAALKSALLTFDHLLGSDPAAFTRSPDLQELRHAILAVIRDGEPADALLRSVSWGMDPDDVEEIQRLRKLYGPPQVSPFEHVLYVTGTKGRSVDLYFFVAGIDLYRYRLTDRWTGQSFGLLCGCGMLVRDAPFGPYTVLQRFHFRKQTEQRALVRAGMLETAEGQEHMKRVAGEIGARRHEATLRAISLVEQRADAFVQDQLEQLYAIDSTLDMAGCVRERLARFYRTHRETAEGRARFDEIVRSGLASLPDDVRAQRVADAVWTVWLSKHRDLARALEAALGLPGSIVVREQHVGHGTATPVHG